MGRVFTLASNEKLLAYQGVIDPFDAHIRCVDVSAIDFVLDDMLDELGAWVFPSCRTKTATGDELR